MKNVSIDIAERKEFALRRRLRSAERLREAAILRGLGLVKTPLSRVRALLSRVTRADQRFPARFECFDLGCRLAIGSLGSLGSLESLEGNARQPNGVPSLACATLRTMVIKKTGME